MRRHLVKRFVFFLAGLVLFYAPFALLTRLLIHLTHNPLAADAHRICLRMPIEWIAQPWMYRTLWDQPLYLIVLVALPGLAFVLGPLFCGWMCPPGMFTEYLSRLLPARWQIRLSGKINPSPIRYGVLAGMVIALFFNARLSCAFCNFSMMQGLVNAGFGDFQGLRHWWSFSILTLGLWLFVLGLFTRGGRGWCNLLCPAGALMGLFHSLGQKSRIGWAVRINSSACQACGTCASVCPAWAVSQASETKINYHACNACLDCVQACPQNAIFYRRTLENPITGPEPR